MTTKSVTFVKPLPSSTGDGKPTIGCMLLEQGKLRPEDIDRVLQLQAEKPIPFGEAALQLALVSQDDIDRVLAHQFDYPYVESGDNGYPPELVAAYAPESQQMEILRTLRTRLGLQWFSRGHREIAVTAVGAGDGTSLLSANLAISFAQQGLRTLLVDANLRHPTQHEIFSLSPRGGLSNILAGRAGLDALVKSVSFPLLSILPAGTLPPNPQELLCRPSFSTLRKALIAHFDVILYDTPALSSAEDAYSVAAAAGGVLVVARRHHAVVAQAKAIADQLRRTGIEVVGSVLNDF